MSTKQRYPLAAAEAVAAKLITHLAPCCKRIEVAGSIRRRRPMVGDVELLAVPSHRDVHDMFGGVIAKRDQLDAGVRELLAGGVLSKRRRVDGAFAGYGQSNKLLVHVASGIPVDLFSTTAKNWGMAQAIRTGPADFVVRMMARFKTLGMRGHASRGVTASDGTSLDCPDEEAVFALLGWALPPPARRR